MKVRANPNDKENKAKLELHHRQAERAMRIMKEGYCPSQLHFSGTSSISIDLEQVLFLPALTHGEMFYPRQLSCHNCCIYVGDTNKGLMHLWHEGLTGRGGNEITSCVLKSVLSGLAGKHKLVVWSDNSDKTKTWIYLVIKRYSQEVNKKNLMSGHSFLTLR